MREKLNENPIAQVALIGVLALAAVFLFISTTGGGEEEGAGGEAEATVSVAGTEASGTATGATPGEAVEGAIESATAEVAAGGVAGATPTSVPAPPPPRPVAAAYDSGKTVVLLIVDEGGIDDRFTRRSAELVASMPDTASFVVPARQIARYAAITVGLEVNRVPALVVMRPRRLSGGTPVASVDYGFQTPSSVRQAVIDAAYKGPEATYHPK